MGTHVLQPSIASSGMLLSLLLSFLGRGGLGEGRAGGGGDVREGREGGGVQTSGQEFNREAACSVVINIMTCLFQGSFGHLPLSFSTLAKDVHRLVFLLQ